MAQELILGFDFWTNMGIIADLFADVWSFRSDSPCQSPRVDAFHPLDSLTYERKTILNK